MTIKEGRENEQAGLGLEIGLVYLSPPVICNEGAKLCL
jgi:hypothetical protein